MVGLHETVEDASIHDSGKHVASEPLQGFGFSVAGGFEPLAAHSPNPVGISIHRLMYTYPAIVDSPGESTDAYQPAAKPHHILAEYRQQSPSRRQDHASSLPGKIHRAATATVV
jgi:hypothetical protein